MKHYKCNQCQHEFEIDVYDDEVCPSCKSSDVKQVKKINPWDELINFMIKNKKKLFFALSIIFILIFLLKGCPPEVYNVKVMKYIPDSCSFKVIVLDGNKELSADKFEYSCDNGNHWVKSPIFKFQYENQVTIKVKLKNSNKNIQFKFINPAVFAFSPACSTDEFVNDPCDCKNLQIISVEQKEINGKLAIIIHSNKDSCNVQYSINDSTGNGKYYSNSIFYLNENDRKLFIFIKTDNCSNPIAYNMNPFVVSPPILRCPTANEMTTLLNKFIKNPETQMMVDLLKLFETPNIQITVIGGSFNTPPTVPQYLQYLKINGKTDNIKVKVSNIQSNKLKQIKIIKVDQTSDKI